MKCNQGMYNRIKNHPGMEKYIFKKTMTPPPTTPKRIEKISIPKDGRIYLRLEPVPDDNFVDVTELVNKINELIDRLSTIEEERK